MKSTNRGLNRTLIFLVGLVVLLLGLAAIALAAIPTLASGWTSTAPAVQHNLESTLQATPMFATGHSWLWLALIAFLLLIVVLLIAFIARQGRGRTHRLFSDATTDHGRTVIRAGVAENAIKDALRDRDELVSSSVSTFEVRGEPVLKISATARRGVSPKDVSSTVEGLLRSLDELLGFEVPALVSISGGFRARVATNTRLQ